MFSPFGKIIDIVCKRTKALRGQAWIVFSDPSAAAASLRQMQGFPFYNKPMRLQFSRKPSKKAVQTLGEAGRQAAAASAQALAAVASAAAAPAGGATASPVLYAGGFPPEVSLEMLGVLFQQYGQATTAAGDVPGTATIRFADADCAARAFQNLQGFRMTPLHQLTISYSATAVSQIATLPVPTASAPSIVAPAVSVAAAPPAPEAAAAPAAPQAESTGVAMEA